jgi:hypothetical protein
MCPREEKTLTAIVVLKLYQVFITPYNYSLISAEKGGIRSKFTIIIEND